MRPADHERITDALRAEADSTPHADLMTLAHIALAAVNGIYHAEGGKADREALVEIIKMASQRLT